MSRPPDRPLLRAHLVRSSPVRLRAQPSRDGAACPQSFPRTGGTDERTVLLGIALLAVIAAMSATGGGVRDQVDPELTTEVEALLAQSPLRDFAGLAPIAAEPPAEWRSPYIGTPFVEIPLVVESGQVVSSGFLPLTDLDTLYGVDDPPVVPVQSAPALDAPPADLVDDTPAMIAWASPPLDAK